METLSHERGSLLSPVLCRASNETRARKASSNPYEILRLPNVRGRLLDPAEEPASEVYSHDRATRVAGEEAAMPLEFAAGDEVLVAVAGQQAELGRLGVPGRCLLSGLTDLRFDPHRKPEPGPICVNGERHHGVFVSPGNLLCPRCIKWKGLRVAVDDPQEVREREADDLLIEGDATWAGVGQ